MKRLEKILAQTAARKMPETPSYGNFCKVTQNPHFLKKCKRRTKENFFKNRPKSSPSLKRPTAPCRKWCSRLKSLYLKCKDWKRFCCKQRLQKCPNGQVMAIFARSTKIRDQGKFFKNCPKTSPRLKGLKELWRKLHYRLNTILL